MELGSNPAGGPPSDGDRVSWVDSARGVGIVLVVVGHTLRGLIGGGLMAWGPAARSADAWIYSFHMPLFFALSGLFLARSASKPWGAFLGDKARTIAYPYLVWSAITLAIKSGLGRHANHPRGLGDLPSILLEPVEQFWFLYALFLLTMAAGLLLKLRVPPLGVLGLAVLAYPGVLPVPAGGWVPLIEARENAPYLAIGVAAGARGWASKVGRAGWPWLALVALAGWVAPGLAVARGAEGLAWLRPMLAIGGTAAVAGVAVLLGRARLDGVARVLGRYSLEIFVAHTIASAATRIALVKVAKVSDPSAHLVLGIVAGLLGPLALAMACERAGFRWAFTMPRPRGISGRRP